MDAVDAPDTATRDDRRLDPGVDDLRTHLERRKFGKRQWDDDKGERERGKSLHGAAGRQTRAPPGVNVRVP